MRIVIETGGTRETLAVSPSVPGLAPADDDAAVDGGQGPAGGGDAAADEAVVTDSGPPPDWLIEAVAEAETTGPAQGDDTDVADDLADAGAGPDA